MKGKNDVRASYRARSGMPDSPSRMNGASVPMSPRYQPPMPSLGQPVVHARHNLLLDVPIAWRLTLGFLLAAVIAASAAGFSGIQRAQSLNRESEFYQSLLASNTAMNNGATFLQLMNAKTQSMLVDATAVPPSTETLTQDQGAITQLMVRYDSVARDYLKNSVLDAHPEQVALLDQTGQGSLITQQRILAASMSRTWRVYRDAVSQVLSDVASGNTVDAQLQVRSQAEPTNTDALSALRAVIQFDGRLAGSVHQAADQEQRDQTITTIAVALAAFLLTAIVGWVISGTLVRRLGVLRKVAESVERGELAARAEVIGTDEIGRVTSSVNGMLDTIVGLLDVTRRQRNALQNAAQRLFADIRTAGAGDLRVNAAVGSDPIGMLANAFNFTTNRFRRFVLRTQSSLDQLDMISRQEVQRSETFLIAAQALVHSQKKSLGVHSYSIPPGSPNSGREMLSSDGLAARDTEIKPRLAQARDLLGKIAREGVNQRSRSVLDLAEQAYLSAGRLSQLAMTAYNNGYPGVGAEVTHAQMDELRTLGALLSQLGTEAAAIQKNATFSLSELDATLTSIDEALKTSMYADSAFTRQGVGGYSVESLLQLSSEFAQEMVTLARQTMFLTRDMRGHVALFRLDQSPEDESEMSLYTPGTR
jgi:methyl-accepting chemotaxis protein